MGRDVALPIAHVVYWQCHWHTEQVRVTARSDYAIRALIEMATAKGELLTCDSIAQEQVIPSKFLSGILTDLRRAGIITSVRGAEGGFLLARDPGQITVADVIRVIDGPLASVHGERPQDVHYEGNAAILQPLWIAVRSSLRGVLENVNIAHLAAERFKQAAGVDMVHVPYKGGGPALVDLLGGQVQLHFNVPINLIAHVKGGRLKAIGITGALAGLKADIATGGLTLGGGMLAGGLIGALGAAGLARSALNTRGSSLRSLICSVKLVPAASTSSR